MTTTVDDATAQHVRRTLRALELLAQGPQTQADLARELVVHRRTARRLLARLVDEGYAETTHNGGHVAFAATSQLAVLGRRVAEGMDVLAIGRRHLATLGEAPASACYIAILEPDGVRLAVVQVADGAPEPAAHPARTGPLHATAAGKVFLSADTALLGDVLNQELLAFTSSTVVTPADLLLELARIRSHGYAVEDGEHRAGERAVASAVVDHVGKVIAALGATPAPGASLDELGRLVSAAARAFSRQLGAAVEDLE